MAGSIRGRRRWCVTVTGTLKALGPDYMYRPLSPGEEGYRATHSGYYPQRQEETLRGYHIVAARDCSCGFYAYFEDSEDEYERFENSVLGIVEGFGRATIGPLGFRCERAHIKALVNPFTVRGFFARTWAFQPAKICLTISALLMFVGFCFWMSGLWIVAVVLSAIGFAALGVTLVASYQTDGAGRPMVDRARWKAMCTKYPYIPIYKSLALAKKDYPLTDPEIAT